jgi:hypothetical protein
MEDNIFNLAVQRCGENTNDLYSDDFLFVIPSLNISQKIQTVLPPEVQGETVDFGYQNRVAKFVPDRIIYSKLIIDLKLNQNLYNYKILSDWMKLYGTYREANLPYEEYKHLYRDMYLYIINPLDSTTPLAYIHYKSCFPVAISNPAFDPSLTSALRISVNFEVEDFNIVIL